MKLKDKFFSSLKRVVFRSAGTRLVKSGRCLHLYAAAGRLTGDIGLHTAMLIDGTWHDSSRGVWQVCARPQELSVTIDWPNLPLRQVWNFSAQTDGFGWTVYADVKEPVKIEKMVCGMNLRDDYEQWFAGAEDGVFPDWTNAWQNIFLSDAQAEVFGVSPGRGLPAIICGHKSAGAVLIQNSPAACSSRALRVESDLPGQKLERTRYKFFFLRTALAANEQEFLSRRRKALEASLAQRRMEDGKLKLVWENNRVHVYWDGRQITSGQGLSAALYANGEWYDSGRCRGHVERVNPRCIYLALDWRPLPVTQAWQLALAGNNTLRWKISTQVNEPALRVEKMSAGIGLSAEYAEWFGGYESGQMPPEFDRWQEIIRDGPGGAVGVISTERFPAVLFKNFDGSTAQLLVQNGDKLLPGRYLQAEQNKDGREADIADFSQEIAFLERPQDVQTHLKSRLDEVIMRRGIEDAPVKLFADKNRLRIFRQEQELTADIGMHTAVRSGGIWYDSGKAHWTVEKVSQRQLKILVDFRPFPACQEWEIRLEPEHVIVWEVRLKLSEAVTIEERKTGLILNGAYRRWFNSFEEGKFPETFGFWHDIIRSRDGETFGVFPEAGRPGVLFNIDPEHYALIQNTDESIRGRVLQAQVLETEETSRYAPQERVCFRGTIRLTGDSRDIEEYQRRSRPLASGAEACFIYADTEELHDRIAGVRDFQNKIEKIRRMRAADRPVKIRLGVSRYNFFKLNEIVQFIAAELGKAVDLRSVKLNVFPLKRLRRNFIEHLEELKAVLPVLGDVELRLVDAQLFDLITAVYAQAGSGNERQLARLLGVICEHAFIGPQIVVVDPYHRCNANCLHCWVHTPRVSHPREFLDAKIDFSAFRKLADDFADLLVDHIIFQGDGEPLLHENFFDMAAYARQKGIQVSFFTNGIALTPSAARRAVELGVREIFCSLPAGKAQTYARINSKQNEAAFAKILDNLRSLAQVKRDAGSAYPRLIMTHVIHTMNAHELPEMAENGIAAGADVMRFYLIRLDKNIQFLRLKEEDVRAIRDALPRIKESAEKAGVQLLDTTEFQLAHFEPESGDWSKEIFLEKGCALGWNFCLVPASGEVSFCCHLRTVGYLREKSFKEIWNSPEYERFRYQAKFLSANRGAAFLNGTPLFDEYCGHCDTHQVIRDVWEQCRLYGLERFLRS